MLADKIFCWADLLADKLGQCEHCILVPVNSTVLYTALLLLAILGRVDLILVQITNDLQCRPSVVKFPQSAYLRQTRLYVCVPMPRNHRGIVLDWTSLSINKNADGLVTHRSINYSHHNKNVEHHINRSRFSNHQRKACACCCSHVKATQKKLLESTNDELNIDH